MNFDWDESKNRINRDKHGVSFEDAQEAFFTLIALFVLTFNILKPNPGSSVTEWSPTGSLRSGLPCEMAR